MTHGSIDIVEINLQYSRSAFAILSKTLVLMQTCIIFIQEPSLVGRAIKELESCRNLLDANPQEGKIRTCTLSGGMRAIFLLQLNTGDLTDVKLKFQAAEEELLLGCDANSHHVGLGSTNTNTRGEALSNFIMNGKLLILN